MEKMDRLGWAVGTAVHAYGLRLGLRANSVAALEQLLPWLPPGCTPAPSPVVDFMYSAILPEAGIGNGIRRFNILYAGAGRIARTMQLQEVTDALETHAQMLVAEYARRRVFVHAGVVEWRGQAIVIPGRSFSGKSMLVAELVRQGATYYSDEYAVLGPTGLVHPYARALGIREEKNAPARRVPVESLGGRAGTRPIPIGLVAATRYREGARWRPRPLSAGQGLLELLAHAVAARRTPQQVIKSLRTALGPAQVLRGVRGAAAATAADLLDRLSHRHTVLTQ